MQLPSPPKPPPYAGGLQAPGAGAKPDELKEFISVVLADIEDVWGARFREMGGTYREPKLVLFSGGVDSFYAVLAPRSWPIDDLLVIHGAFDLMHARRDAFERVQAKLQAAADALGKVLIPSATNLLHTRLGTTDLAYMSQGSMMGSVPLALERRYARILIPSSVDLDWKEAWGTHPITDAMLSTSATFVAEDGYAAKRIEKIAFVARSDVALSALRVCLFTGNENNCMRCEKCLRAAITLETLGVLQRAAAFGTAKLDLRRVARMPLGDPDARHYYEDLVVFCRERGRGDLSEAIARALARARRHDAPAAGVANRRGAFSASSPAERAQVPVASWRAKITFRSSRVRMWSMPWSSRAMAS